MEYITDKFDEYKNKINNYVSNYTNSNSEDKNKFAKNISELPKQIGDNINLNNPYITYFTYSIIVTLIIVTFVLIFNVGSSDQPADTGIQSEQETVKNVFIVLFVIFLFFTLCITLVPKFKDLKTFLFQIKNVVFVILYVLFLILFFRLLPSDILNEYSSIILPITILIAATLFYFSLKTDYINKFNVNYERIKVLILFFCLIILFVVYYYSNPGGYVTEYFGYSSLLVIIFSVFAFLYLIVLISLPESIASPNVSNLLSNFSKTSIISTVSFLAFIIAITITLSVHNSNTNLTNNKDIFYFVIFLTLIICSLWSILLISNLFPEIANKNIIVSKISSFKKILLTLFGVVMVGLIIAWIVYDANNNSSTSNITGIVLSVILLLIVLFIMYKFISVKLPYGNYKKNSFLNLLYNIIFYIPCLFIDAYKYTYDLLTNNKTAAPKNEIIALFVIILSLISYLILPNILKKMYLQGGNTLIDYPIYIDKLTTIGTYETLNKSSQYDYNYGISFWVFLDSMDALANNNYMSILNYGDTPNIQYNYSNNTLLITMKQKDVDKNTSSNKMVDFDDKGNKIIYKTNKILLQKWNNIIINYVGGTLDIFLNGELIKSAIEVAPYYTLDNLTVGENNGISGGMCNLIYFNKSLSASRIYYLYNMVKYSNPPVIGN
jgi:hypothetical protein